jgi:hypothetical protein
MTDKEIRAANAAQLKDNAFLEEILSQIEAEAHKAWLATSAQGGQEAREFAWVLAKATQRIRDVIQSAIDDQKISASRATAPLR